MDIDSIKKVGVVGWGRSGIALCDALLALKKEVKLTEIKEKDSFHPLPITRYGERGVQFEFGANSEKFIKDCQLVVLSPGVDPLTSDVARISKELGILCVGEVEFAFWLTKAKFIAITGTNGKSTTTFLTYRALKEKRKRVFLGGNIGIPVSSFVLNTKKGDLIVLEISSFQLETILEFRPHVAVLLNVGPNHLDRHPTFKDYLNAKMNIFKNQKKDDWAIINKDMRLRSDVEKNIKAKVLYFSDEFDNANYSCACRIASIFDVAKADCVKAFSEFKGLPHRMQFVKRINGVTFVNDSKSTNPSSTIWALKNTRGKIILIAGGKDKGVDYDLINPYLEKVKKLNLIGQAAPKIKNELGLLAAVEIFPSLEDAVAASFAEASRGDTVILSPMCASFDMFMNYMDRGRKFVQIVNSLGE